MRWLLRKSHPLPGGGKSLKVLKIITIVSPALFFFLLELLRQAVFGEIRPMIWDTLSLFLIAIVAAFFFSKLVFAAIDRRQKENLQRIRELATLSEVYKTVDEYHNLNALLNRAMNKLIQITSADSSELYLVDEQSRELVHTLHSGLLEDVFKEETQLKLKDWLVNKSVLVNQQVIIENWENSRSSTIAFLADAGVRSMALIPLNSRSGPVGIACLFDLKPGHLKLNEANLLFNIGNPIAVAIENARLYEKVQAAAVLEERERISTELHDGLAQVLGYVITKSQAARQLLRKVTVAADYLAELENVAQEVYTDTREAILGLRTVISGDRSMVSALREYARQFNQMYGIKTEVTVSDRIIPSLSPQIELQVVRIVQEALSNIRKHAEATRAIIKVVAEDGVTIVVEDDGKGFDVDNVGKGDYTKFGLRNMKERANRIHGRLSVESGPENGTRVTLSIPLTSSQTVDKEGEEIESADS